MTANRKAELQRKLTLAPVAKPPAGLAERIKREIPKELRFNVEAERERLSKAVSFNLRVAASILILVSSAYFGLQFLSQVDEKGRAAQQPARIPVAIRPQPKVAPLADAVKEEQQEARRPTAPAVVAQKKTRVDKRDLDRERQVAAAPAATATVATEQIAEAAPAPPPTANVVTQSGRASGMVAMNRAETKSMASKDVETTTSPVSGKEMRYTASDKNVQVVTSKLRDEKITPWASVSPAAKLKILEEELAAGADKKTIARIAREAGLTVFADKLEKP